MITRYNAEATRRAEYSDCERYRFRLVIGIKHNHWSFPSLMVIGLNPSTATEMEDDPTVHRLRVRAVEMGFGKFTMTNLFAFRSTDPNGMKAQADPVGAENDLTLRDVADKAAMILCAWGRHGNHLDRARRVMDFLPKEKLHCLGVNSDGTPKHPLYLSYDIKPMKFNP